MEVLPQLTLWGGQPPPPYPALHLHVDYTQTPSSPAPQCAATNPSSIWPLEDAVEFQGVAAELRSAAAGERERTARVHSWAGSGCGGASGRAAAGGGGDKHAHLKQPEVAHTAGLAALGGRLSRDVQQDAAHVYQQLMGLSFTEDELSGAGGRSPVGRFSRERGRADRVHEPACRTTPLAHLAHAPFITCAVPCLLPHILQRQRS